jgi:predicted CxxxxCH...CXXCH cytochrome family protein
MILFKLLINALLKEFDMKVHASTVIRTALIALLLMLVPIVLPETSSAAPGSITACTDCHGNPPVDPATATRDAAAGTFQGNHSTHSFAGNCNKCHNTVGATEYNHSFRTQVAGVNYINMTSVINKSPKAGAKYNNTKSFPQSATPALTTCANVNCHFEQTTPAWGSVLPAATWSATKAANDNSANCGNCHAVTSALLTSGKHATHITSFGNTQTACAKCHPDYNTLSGAAAFKHATSAVRNINVNFAAAPNSGSGTYAGGRTNQQYLPSGTVSAGTCSTLYCHSSGKRAVVNAAVEPTTPAWNGTALDCKGCHGAQPVGANVEFTSVAGEPNYFSVTAGSATANSHKKHVGTVLATAQTSCQGCHRVTTANGTTILAGSATHLDKNIDVRFKSAAFTTLSGLYNKTTRGCSTTYCHGAGAPVWGGAALACNSCHSALSTDAGFTNNAHKLHVSTAVQARFDVVSGNVSTVGAYRFGCAACHDPGNAGVAHGQGAVGTNQAANVFFRFTTVGKASVTTPYAAGTLGGTDSSSYKWTVSSGTTCNNTYCHSNGQVAATFVAAPAALSWATSSSSGSCTICHGNGISGSALSGKHSMHLNKVSNASLGNTIPCMECHVKTVNTVNNTLITDKSKHVNKMRDYSGAKANRSGWNGTTCSTYCHSTGADGSQFKLVSMTWTSGTVTNCKACHGSQSGPTYFTSKYGEPNYRNLSTLARDTFNSHSTASHVSSATSCYNCHNLTVKSGVQAIVSSATGFGSASSRHLNKTSDVNLASGTYNATARTCTNVSCHSNNVTPVRWGSKLNCDSCHPRAALSGAHTRHTGAYRAITVYANMTANKSTGSDTNGSAGNWTNYGFGCSVCHPLASTNHGNGSVELELNRTASAGSIKSASFAVSGATPAVGAGGSATTCANIYCHSDGKGVYLTTDTWATTYTAANRCIKCHGNSPADASHGMHDVGIHYDSTAAAVPGTGLLTTAAANPTNAAHGDPLLSTTISCYICHNATISGATAASRYNKYNAACNTCHTADADGTKNIFITGLSSHVNGAVNVQFAAVQIRTKAQLRSGSFSSYTGNATENGWSPTGRVYKTAAAYDISKRALNAGTAGWNGSTCANIVCHTGHTNVDPNWVTSRGVGCTLCHNEL